MSGGVCVNVCEEERGLLSHSGHEEGGYIRGKGEKEEIGVTFRNLVSEIEVGNESILSTWREFCWRREGEGERRRKKVLKGVSGFCPPASLLAIMGSSGAGKVCM